MTAHHKHRSTHPRLHRRVSTDLDTVDVQWKTYHRFIFQICARHLSPSDDLVEFALTVAETGEIKKLVTRLLARKDELNISGDAATSLESVATPAQSSVSLQRLQHICYRVARHNEALHAIIVDYILDTVATVTDPPTFPDIVKEIASLFSLSPEHSRILIALFALEDIESMSNVMRQATHRTQMKILADVAEVDLTTFVRETAPGSTLERLGLIAYRGGRDEMSDMDVSRPLLFALRSNTLDDLRAGLFDQTPAPQFQISEFSVPDEEIRNCTASVRGGHPLLIAGEPGIGKTEFARTLISALGRNAYTLSATNRHSDDYRPPRGADREGSRLNAIRMAVNLLSPQTDVLIIDEADAILQSAAGFFGLFGKSFGSGSYDKAVLNDLLENLSVATIWIINDHHMIPASALRRFGHVFAFPHPSVDTRVRMLSERLAPVLREPAGSIADRDLDTWTRDLAARYDITPAAIDRTARIVTAELDTQELSHADVRERVSGYIQQISTGALAHDVRRLPTVTSSFDPRFCSTSESLNRIERLALHRAKAGSALRLLFGGPPGGGKTQYALWLAKRLGRDVVLKRPSDLLSKWVGQSEQQIATAFRTAAQAGSVLVIDEADALLYNRSIAQHSWEHSQIAEFLQQIQEYTGILIACTNRVDAVDPALRRRFHKHVTFGPISDEVLPGALAHIFPNVSFADTDIASLQQGPPLMMSDLATAAEMLEIELTDVTADYRQNAPREKRAPSQETTSATTVVDEILANARTRDRTSSIGF